jgi:hypothetical protein
MNESQFREKQKYSAKTRQICLYKALAVLPKSSSDCVNFVISPGRVLVVDSFGSVNFMYMYISEFNSIPLQNNINQKVNTKKLCSMIKNLLGSL